MHKQVCETIAIPSYEGLQIYTHKALKQLASKTKHLGQYCVRLSCGYSRGTKVISKQNIKAKIALPSWIFTKIVRRTSTLQTFQSMQDTRLNFFRRNFLTHLECISKVSTQFRAPRPMWPRLPTINYLGLRPW